MGGAQDVVLRSRDASWTRAELRDRVTRVRSLVESVPVDGCAVVAADHTPYAVAAVLGALEADRRVALVEATSSDLRRADGALAALGPDVVLAPAGTEVGFAVPAQVDLHHPAPAAGRAAGAVPRGSEPAAARPEREVLQLTSGSTGLPKLARQTRGGVAVGVAGYREHFALTRADRVLLPVPVVHSYGLAALLASTASGAPVTLGDVTSPSALLEEVAEHTTVLFGTPLLYRLASAMWGARPRPRRLRILLSAGAPVPPTVAWSTRETLGVPVRQIYGTTEAGLIACVPAACEDWPAGSVGRFIDGITTSRASDGSLTVAGPGVFRGYAGDPDRPAGSGWATGDVVDVGDGGFVTVAERADTVVKVGGRRVATAPVVEAVASCAGVRDAAVTARLTPEGEAHVVAVVVAEPWVVDADVLAACRRAGLAAHEVPRAVVRVPRLPRSGIHKLTRRQVDALLDDPGADVGATEDSPNSN